jgi:23S rRNA (guanosine2251-2'-O)-methyltransferase
MREEQIYGRHPVLEALRGEAPVEKVYFQEGIQEVDALREIRRRVREAHIPFVVSAKAVLDRLAGNAGHQGVVASVAIRDYATFDDVLARAAARQEQPLVLLLDEIQDPRNLGSLLRTADAAGVHGVGVCTRRAAGLTGTVSKTAAGADAHVPVFKMGNVASFLAELADQGWEVVGAAAEADCDYREAEYRNPVALVLGGEQKGLGRLVKTRCTKVVRIPMQGEVSSLNVSVAGALLMYEALRARRPVASSGQAAASRARAAARD